MALGQRIHLDGYVLGAGDRQNTQRVVVEYKAIRVVVDDQDIVPSAKVDDAFKQFS